VTEGTSAQSRGIGGISHRAAALLAWSVCGLSFVLTTLSLLLLALTLESLGVHIFTYRAEDTVVTLAFSTIGAIIVSRRPEHPIGWLFCVIGLLAGIDHLCGEYAIYALLAHPEALPAGEAAAWVRSWVWVLYIGVGMFLVLLFPDGRLPSRRWKPFAWFVVIVVFLGAIAVAFSPGPVDGLGPIENPLVIELLGFGPEGSVDTVVEALLFVPLASIAAGSLLVRLRRSRGVERQQVKWFAYAEVVLVIGTIALYTISESSSVPWWVPSVGFLLTMVGIAGWTIGVAIAILRHRLYDIDLLINRTLVYGSLTATLIALYFVGIVVLQRVFVALTGQQSTLAVVASTLLIAALFTPLRRRIQGFIDRRFYRRKYDARKTLEAFSTKLRDETDLEALNNDLVGVVRETMQPAHVSVWLRPDPAQRRVSAD
jgi:hypothetical protein